MQLIEKPSRGRVGVITHGCGEWVGCGDSGGQLLSRVSKLVASRGGGEGGSK